MPDSFMPDSLVPLSERPRTPRERTYRAYTLTSEDGLASVEILDAEDDGEAVALASVLPSRYGIELWERGRFLGGVAPPPPGRQARPRGGWGGGRGAGAGGAPPPDRGTACQPGVMDRGRHPS